MKTVLIVDDDPLILKMRVDRLIQEGYNVLQGTNGEEGLAIALEKHPDVIVLDIVMPIMDGLTALKKIREDSWGKDAPVMILSTQQDSNTISEAMNSKIFRYVVKDHDAQPMIDAIHVMLKDK